MLRTDLFKLAQAAGWKAGAPLDAQVRKKIEQALRAALTPAVLRDAPMYHYAESGQDKQRAMTVEDAVAALMEELQ